MNCADAPLLHRPKSLAIAVAAALVALALPVVAANSPVLTGELWDPDGYMWLLRVERLRATGAWFDAHVPAIDAPYGETNHWTRPMDLLLLGGALALEPLLGSFREALFLWATLLCPLLMVAAVFVFSWGSRPILSDGQLVMGTALFGLSVTLNVQFAFGRADHHALFLLLTIAHAGVLVRLATGGGAHLAWIAGGLTGLTLWLGVEGLVTAAFCGGGLALLAARRGEVFRAHLERYLLATALAAGAALLIEVPPDRLTTPFGSRLSLYHPVLFACGWAAVRGLRAAVAYPPSPVGRLLHLAAAAAIGLAVMAAVFPAFFLGPLEDFDRPVVEPWLDQIREFQPLWPARLADVPDSLVHLWPAVFCLLYTALRWRRTTVEVERSVLLVLATGLLLYLPLALDAVRWAMYLGAIGLYLWPLAITAVTDAVAAAPLFRRGTSLGRAAVLAGVVLVVTLGPFAVLLATPRASAADADATAGAACDWPGAFEALGQLARSGDIPSETIVLTYSALGPELAWRSGLRAVGAPYGNARALRDTATSLGATDDAAARAVLRRRGIGLVLVCAAHAETDHLAAGSPDAMIRRLVENRPPRWLMPTRLQDVPAPVLAYEVRLDML